MTAQVKTKLDTLISEGKVQHIYGVIGCCKNYYVQFPNETPKIHVQYQQTNFRKTVK